MSEMTIAKLGKAAGVGVETVRYYQRRGLMPTPRAPMGGFRTYEPEHLSRLRFIRRAQAAGFTLEEIKELLDLDRTTDRDRVRDLAGLRLKALAEQMAELQAAERALKRLLGICRGSEVGPCPIIEAFDES